MGKENDHDIEKIHENVYNASVNGTIHQALKELDKKIRDDPYKVEDTLKFFYEHFEHHPDDLIKWCNWFTEDKIEELKNKYDYLKFKFGEKRFTFPSESEYLEAKKIDSDLIVKDEPNSHSLTIRMVLTNVNDDAVNAAIAQKKKEEARKKKIIIGALIAIIGAITICAIAIYATSDHPVNKIDLSTDSDVMSINDQIAVKFDVNSDASDKTLRWECDNGTVTRTTGNMVYVKLNKYVESGKTINITAISDKYNIKATKTITISNENCCSVKTENKPTYISSLDEFDITAYVPDVLKNETGLSFKWSSSEPDYIDIKSLSNNKVHIKLNGLAQGNFSIYYEIEEFDDICGSLKYEVTKKTKFSVTTDYPSVRPDTSFSLNVKADGIDIDDIEWIINENVLASVAIMEDEAICNLISASDGDTVKIECRYGQLSSEVTFKVEKNAPLILSPVVSISNWSYSDTASTPVVAGIDENTVVNYSYYCYSDNTTSQKVPTAVGSYRIDATIDKTASHYAASASQDFSITKKDISAITFGLVSYSAEYSGTAKNVSVNNVQLNDRTLSPNDYAVVTPDDMINSGDKIIVLNGVGNYTGTSYLSMVFTIDRMSSADSTMFVYDLLSKIYNGSQQGITVSPKISGLGDLTVLYEGDDEVPKDAGTYYVEVMLSNSSNNYDILVTLGQYTIDRAPIGVTPNELSKKYSEDDPIFTYTYNSNITSVTPSFIGKLSREPGEDVGRYNISLGTLALTDSGQFKASNYCISFHEVQFQITKRTIVVTSHSSSKTYDGTPLTDNDCGISGDGFALGEGLKYSFTGTQTFLGSSENTFSYSPNAGTRADNYDITASFGTLTVTAIETPITITANSSSRMYNGTALTDGGYTYTDDVLIEGDVLTAVVTGTITDYGSVENYVSSYKVMHGTMDVTDCYTFGTPVDGTLSISKRNITLTSLSASKYYDGTALTKNSVSITGSGFISGEGATYNVTGSRTDVGISANTFTYTLYNNTKAINYNIMKVEGTLTVIAVYHVSFYDRGTLLSTWSINDGCYVGDALIPSPTRSEEDGYTYSLQGWSLTDGSGGSQTITDPTAVPVRNDTAYHAVWAATDLYNGYQRIYSGNEFKSTIESNLNGSYVLMNDIILPSSYVPITGVFSGELNGNDKNISGLRIHLESDTSQKQFHGLFEQISGYAYDFSLTSPHVYVDLYHPDSITEMFVGGVCGRLDGGHLNNVDVTGAYIWAYHDSDHTSKKVYAHVGGLVGEQYYGLIENCSITDSSIFGKTRINYNNGSVADCWCHVGGIVGNQHNGTINNCSRSDDVSVQAYTLSGSAYSAFHVYAGGITGYMVSGNITSCTSSSNNLDETHELHSRYASSSSWDVGNIYGNQ